MTNFEILSLAYQRQAEGVGGSLVEIIDQVKTDLLAMETPPLGPDDEAGFVSEKISGVIKQYKIMGDGRKVEVQQ